MGKDASMLPPPTSTMSCKGHHHCNRRKGFCWHCRSCCSDYKNTTTNPNNKVAREGGAVVHQVVLLGRVDVDVELPSLSLWGKEDGGHGGWEGSTVLHVAALLGNGKGNGARACLHICQLHRRERGCST